MAKERRKLHRRAFAYYMRVFDDRSDTPLGHLTDISVGGFQLDCQQPVKEDRAFQLRIEVPPGLSAQPFMHFVARCKWCRVDPIDAHTYNVGFRIEEMKPEVSAVFKRMVEEFGSDTRPKPTDDYLWR